jgi:hypothetical protein
LADDYNLVVTRGLDFDAGGNDSMGTAQAIAGQGQLLGSVAAAATTVIDWSSSGWWDGTGFSFPGNTNYFVGFDPFYAELRNFFVFDLASIDRGSTVTAATLELFNPVYEGTDPFETYTMFDVSTEVLRLVGGGGGGFDIFADLGSGEVYGSGDVTPADQFSLLSFELTEEARAAIGASAGGLFAIGGALTSIDYAGGLQAIFSYSGFPEDTRRLTVTTEDVDYYAIEVTEEGVLVGSTSTPGDAPGEFANDVDPILTVLDADGNVVGWDDDGGWDERNALLNLSGLEPGTYFIRVEAASGRGEYVLSASNTVGVVDEESEPVGLAAAVPSGPATLMARGATPRGSSPAAPGGRVTPGEPIGFRFDRAPDALRPLRPLTPSSPLRPPGATPAVDLVLAPGAGVPDERGSLVKDMLAGRKRDRGTIGLLG